MGCGGGDDGVDSLVATETEPAGANCVAGGLKIATGRDRNGSGVLDADEVDSTSFLCSGEGVGPQSLVSVSAEAAGVNCPGGGSRIDSGLDDNEDGALDTDEIDSTDFVCSEPGTLLASTPVSPGLDCANGGDRVDYGVDTDFNGVLDAEEVQDSVLVCSGVCQGQIVAHLFDFGANGSSQTSLLDLSDVQITGSPGDVNVLSLNGLGVVGGLFDNALDDAEALTFSFVGFAVRDVVYEVTLGGNQNGNVTAADASLEAFAIDATSLGILNISGTGSKEVSTLFNNNPVASFVVTADGDAQRISQLSFNRCE